MAALIDETAIQHAAEFVEKFPEGFLRDAVHGEITYIGRITALFEGKLRELIPYKFPVDESEALTTAIPVLEGKVLADVGREEV